MTRKTVLVTAEWALYGKTSADRGNRLLGWSDGTLSERNFEHVITRYTPGTLRELPQVTVTYLPAERGDLHYVALAIHHEPPDGRVDVDKRRIELTSYYCAPYHELAAAAVSYVTMLDAFGQVRLPELAGHPQGSAETRRPIPFELEARPVQSPARDDLALPVAALLLTGRPVCVLGADQVHAAERLLFIDKVMALLPYGMRARLSAATWTSSTYSGHKFRLFFSDHPRDADDPDHVVTWDGRTPDIPNGFWHARAYLEWLLKQNAPPTEWLADQTRPRGFSDNDVTDLIAQIGIAHEAPKAIVRSAPAPAASPQPASVAAQTPAAEIERLLTDLVEPIKDGDKPGLRDGIRKLSEVAGARPDLLADDARSRYRAIIGQFQLFREGTYLGRLEMPFYDALLRVGFGLPLTYPGYRQLEDCLRGQPPHHSLLQAVLDGGPVLSQGRPANPVVPLLARYYMGDERRLWKWLRSDEVDVRQLVKALAGDWKNPEHAKIILDYTLSLVRDLDKRQALPDLRPTLAENAHLAPAMERRYPGQAQRQVKILSPLLRTAYGYPIDAAVARQILSADGGGRATPGALFYTVVLMLDTRGRNIDEVLTEFVRNLLEYFIDGSGLDQAMMKQLRARMLQGGPLHDGQPRATLAIDPSREAWKDERPPASRSLRDMATDLAKLAPVWRTNIKDE